MSVSRLFLIHYEVPQYGTLVAVLDDNLVAARDTLGLQAHPLHTIGGEGLQAMSGYVIDRDGRRRVGVQSQESLRFVRMYYGRL